jgi:hypothetical protein
MGGPIEARAQHQMAGEIGVALAAVGESPVQGVVSC